MIDRDEIERRRFARLLGIDGAVGSGLPIGVRAAGGGDGRERSERDRPTEGDS